MTDLTEVSGAPNVPGEAVRLSPLVRRLLAPNPSPMTLHGTNTYLIGNEEVAVIDPGPLSQEHLDAIRRAVGETARVSHILVTHSHLDHSPLARPLQEMTGASIYAYGASTDGRSPLMQQLADSGLAGGGEGMDVAFSCDHRLRAGDKLKTNEWTLGVLHTPGHTANHLSFSLGSELFCGDHVMAWSSSLVSPPDGDLSAFMTSCHQLKQGAWQRFLPGHGPPIDTPHERLDWLISHRLQREEQILARVAASPANASKIAQDIYQDLSPRLLSAAERNVFAHLIDLYARELLATPDPLSPVAMFTVK